MTPPLTDAEVEEIDEYHGKWKIRHHDETQCRVCRLLAEVKRLRAFVKLGDKKWLEMQCERDEARAAACEAIANHLREQAENARLREALQEIADPNRQELGHHRARRALEDQP